MNELWECRGVLSWCHSRTDTSEKGEGDSAILPSTRQDYRELSTCQCEYLICLSNFHRELTDQKMLGFSQRSQEMVKRKTSMPWNFSTWSYISLKWVPSGTKDRAGRSDLTSSRLLVARNSLLRKAFLFWGGQYRSWACTLILANKQAWTTGK